MVFDGAPLLAKMNTNQARGDTRAACLELGLGILDGDGAEGDNDTCPLVEAKADRLFVAAVGITLEMAKAVYDFARGLGVEAMVAPHEADAQITFLVNSGDCKAAITEVTLGRDFPLTPPPANKNPNEGRGGLVGGVR